MAIQSKNLHLNKVFPVDDAAYMASVPNNSEVNYRNADGRVYVGDGTTPGGIAQARLSDLNQFATHGDLSDAVAGLANAEQVGQSIQELRDVAAANNALVMNVDGRVRTLEDKPHVVERSGTADGTWQWIVFSDGWVEQLGWWDNGSNIRGLSHKFTLPKEMDYDTYNAFITARREGAGNDSMACAIREMNSTGFVGGAYGIGSSDLARHLHVKIEGWMKEKP